MVDWTRRDFLIGSGAALGALALLPELLAACGNTPATVSSGLWTNLADVAAKAKKEGTLVFYYIDPTNAKIFTDGFVKAYPWANVSTFSAGLPDMKTKWIAEDQAGVPRGDVMGTVPQFLQPLEAAKTIAAVDLPNDKLLLPGLNDVNHHLHPTFIVPQIVAYNRNISAPPPTDLFMLADPVYKNKIAMDNPSSGLTSGLVLASRRKLWGDTKWMQWLQGLKANNPFFASDPPTALAAVSRGERPIGIGTMASINGQPAGGPLAPVFYDNLVVTPLAEVINAKAPHPHMAALFLNWLQSTEGQNVVATTGFTPSTTVDSSNSLAKILPKGAQLLPVGGPTSLQDYYDNVDAYNKIFTSFWPAA
jgi:ABC-type Fe3+ transport system substrate-binding protein